MPSKLTVGLRHSQSMTIDASLTVPSVSPKFAASFADMPEVFATGLMIAFVEAACIELMRPYLAEGQRSVGTQVNIAHQAATPVGMTVTAEVEVTGIEKRAVRFSVSCRDDVDVIATGTHERAIIDLERFAARIEAKSASRNR